MYCGRRRLDLELMWADADGRKLALQCAQHGTNVVLGARSPGFLNDVATEIAHAGGDAIAVPCDVTQQHERRALMGWMDGEPLRKNFDSRAKNARANTSHA
jgi:NAD(P)-dependent dehydrogenase (short-subunit alcohol dehydrogenase family)